MATHIADNIFGKDACEIISAAIPIAYTLCNLKARTDDDQSVADVSTVYKFINDCYDLVSKQVIKFCMI